MEVHAEQESGWYIVEVWFLIPSAGPAFERFCEAVLPVRMMQMRDSSWLQEAG